MPEPALSCWVYSSREPIWLERFIFCQQKHFEEVVTVYVGFQRALALRTFEPSQPMARAPGRAVGLSRGHQRAPIATTFAVPGFVQCLAHASASCRRFSNRSPRR